MRCYLPLGGVSACAQNTLGNRQRRSTPGQIAATPWQSTVTDGSIYSWTCRCIADIRLACQSTCTGSCFTAVVGFQSPCRILTVHSMSYMGLIMWHWCSVSHAEPIHGSPFQGKCFRTSCHWWCACVVAHDFIHSMRKLICARICLTSPTGVHTTGANLMTWTSWNASSVFSVPRNIHIAICLSHGSFVLLCRNVGPVQLVVGTYQ